MPASSSPAIVYRISETLQGTGRCHRAHPRASFGPPSFMSPPAQSHTHLSGTSSPSRPGSFSCHFLAALSRPGPSIYLASPRRRGVPPSSFLRSSLPHALPYQCGCRPPFTPSFNRHYNCTPRLAPSPHSSPNTCSAPGATLGQPLPALARALSW
jgi:hypothetical protein